MDKRFYQFGAWSLPRCDIEAWSKYEGELSGFLIHSLAEDR